MEKQSKDRILSIDLLRFFAATAVMLYHYVFMFTQRGYTTYNYDLLLNTTQYGYLGVDLFFIISGFVITMSANKRTLWQFATSRIARLYPIYWSSVIITSIFIYFFGNKIDTTINLKVFLTNMTMIPSVFRQPYVDGSYWSLTVELTFYIFIGLLLLINKYQYLEKITTPLSFILVLGAYLKIIPFNWISYFLAGITFYFIYKTGVTKLRALSLLTNLISSIIYATDHAPGLSDNYHTNFNTEIILIYIISFYILFLLISIKIIDKLINKITNSKTKNFLFTLGSLTFPIYLLHQTIGHIFLRCLERVNLPNLSPLIITSLFIISLSFVLTILIENRSRNIIFKLSDKLKDILYRQSSQKPFST